MQPRPPVVFRRSDRSHDPDVAGVDRRAPRDRDPSLDIGYDIWEPWVPQREVDFVLCEGPVLVGNSDDEVTVGERDRRVKLVRAQDPGPDEVERLAEERFVREERRRERMVEARERAQELLEARRSPERRPDELSVRKAEDAAVAGQVDGRDGASLVPEENARIDAEVLERRDQRSIWSNENEGQRVPCRISSGARWTRPTEAQRSRTVERFCNVEDERSSVVVVGNARELFLRRPDGDPDAFLRVVDGEHPFVTPEAELKDGRVRRCRAKSVPVRDERFANRVSESE